MTQLNILLTVTLIQMKMLLNLMVLVVGGVVYGQETGQRVGSGLGEGQGAQIAAGQVSALLNDIKPTCSKILKF